MFLSVSCLWGKSGWFNSTILGSADLPFHCWTSRTPLYAQMLVFYNFSVCSLNIEIVLWWGGHLFYHDIDRYVLVFNSSLLFSYSEQQELIKLRESSRFLEEHGHGFGQRERLDSTGSIDEPTETKRLQNEIIKLQAECQRWKSISERAVSCNLYMFFPIKRLKLFVLWC